MGVIEFATMESDHLFYWPIFAEISLTNAGNVGEAQAWSYTEH
jgi:hypothetical protein